MTDLKTNNKRKIVCLIDQNGANTVSYGAITAHYIFFLIFFDLGLFLQYTNTNQDVYSNLVKKFSGLLHIFI